MHAIEYLCYLSQLTLFPRKIVSVKGYSCLRAIDGTMIL